MILKDRTGDRGLCYDARQFAVADACAQSLSYSTICQLSNFRRQSDPDAHAKIEGDTIKGKIASLEFPARLVLTKDPGYQRAKLNYRVEKVFVVHGKVNLNANLFLPNSKKPVAAVIMVAGTGQRTKEEYNGWADLLASRGFAVLTYDKRNVTNFPNLNIRNAPTDIGNINDLVEDAAQAFRLLKLARKLIRKKSAFLVLVKAQ